MISIKEIVSKKGNYAFLCKGHTHFKMCIKQAFDEGIVFTKTLGSWPGSSKSYTQEYDYIIANFTKYLSSNNVYVLMRNNGREIQFYARDIEWIDSADYYGFDWSEWEIIDYTSLIRNSKINEIIKD